MSRLCLDQLGSARHRHETYVGEWLPVPVATGPEADPSNLSMAFLLLLERLSPAERAAFLLAEVFDDRQLAARSRRHIATSPHRHIATSPHRHIKEDRPRPVDRDDHTRALGAFATACATGDLATLERLPAADVMLRGLARKGFRQVLSPCATTAARRLGLHRGALSPISSACPSAWAC